MLHLKFLLGGTVLALTTLALAQSPPPDHATAQKLMRDGNYAEALEQFRSLTLEAPTERPAIELVEDFRGALDCYQQLNKVAEIDDYREAVVKEHPKDWRLLRAVAGSYAERDHHGYLIGGEFRRGNHRGGGEVVSALARDRVRALQIFKQALELVTEEERRPPRPERC
jgi:tetratricopeptide (TPR) repeat protein